VLFIFSFDAFGVIHTFDSSLSLRSGWRWEVGLRFVGEIVIVICMFQGFRSFCIVFGIHEGPGTVSPTYRHLPSALGHIIYLP
jgi:hypothetical protein